MTRTTATRAAATARPTSANGTSGSPTYERIVQTVTGAGISQADLAQAVGSSLRTVQNWAAGDASPRGQKVRQLLDLSYLVDYLKDVYTDEGIEIWLHSRNRNLDGNRPIDLITTGHLDKVLEEAERVAGAM